MPPPKGFRNLILRNWANFFSFSKISIALWCFSFLPFGKSLSAQDCQLPTSIVCTEKEPSLYKVITTSKTFSQMIAAGELLPQAISGSAPQFLVVCQSITDNLNGWYYFAEGSEIIFLNNSSELQINNGAKLHFTGSYLHGCQKLWNRIRVVPGGHLQLTSNCRIEDALRAVYLEPFSAFVSQGSRFDGNYTAIFAGAAGNPFQHNIIATIAGTTFSGQKPLLENVSSFGCTFDNPLTGIKVQNVSQFTIGVVGGEKNTFIDFKASSISCINYGETPTGIASESSGLTVVNSIFKNIDYSSNSKKDGTGIGIYLVSAITVPASTLDFTGLGKAETSQLTFENVHYGVYGLGNITVRESRFKTLQRGVFLTGIPGPYDVTIQDNAFSDVQENMVYVEQISPINNLFIRENTFDDNADNKALQHTGIYVFSSIPGKQNSWIFDNNFLNTNKPMSEGIRGVGISVLNLNGALIEQNQFTDADVSSNFYTGIRTNKASTSIWNNNFTGDGNWDELHPSVAIYAEESPECWLSCNVADQTKIGWEFKGMNSDGARLVRNHLNTHDIGLLLRSDAIIGNQNNLRNRWIGNGSNVEALFTGRSPGVLGDLQFVQLSRFRIHTPDMDTDFWPAPRLIGTTPDAGDWFTYDDTPTAAECIISGGGGDDEERLALSIITEADKRVMDNTFQAVKGYAAGVWEAKLRLYGRLDKYPDLRPANSPESAWYAAQQNTTVSQLSNLYQGILSLSYYSDQEQGALQDAMAVQQSAAQALADKDAQIGTSLDNQTALEQRISERQQLEPILTNAMAAYQNLFNGLRNTKMSEAQQLLAQVDAISTSEQYETDFKTVCRILLETYISQSNISETNRLTLSAIAQQCRYEGGFAVLQARASLEGEWSAYDNCPDAPEARNSENNATNTLSLYPNPAKDAALLDMGYVAQSGRIILRDLSGQILQEWTIEAQQQIMLRWGKKFSAGLYLLEVNADQAAPTILKLTIQSN